MRIQIELKRDAVPDVVLNQLFKHTPLQSTFGYNAVALVDGVPRTLSLLELVTHYLNHQREVVSRRSKYRLRKAEDRAHILAGYLVALDHIDEVVALIRGASDTDDARSKLMDRFQLSEIQAQAILDLRLRALTGLERTRVEEEYAELQALIAELRAILGDPARIDGVIREELLAVRAEYGSRDERRTEIVASEGQFDLEDLIAEEDMVIAITRSGYVKRLPVTTYREQRRGGIGVMGMDLKDDDYIEHLFVASTHDYILFFTSVGKVYRLKVHELPLGSRQSKGRAVVNLLPLRQDEQIRAVVATRDFLGLQVPRLRDEARRREEDRLHRVQHAAQGGRDHRHQAPRRRRAGRRAALLGRRRRADDLPQGPGGALPRGRRTRAMGRATEGVRGMRLRGDDEVIEIAIARDDEDLLVVTENGFGKRTRVGDYRLTGRGGLGVKTVQLTEARGKLAGARVVHDGLHLMLISTAGTVIRMPVEEVKRLGRATQGVTVMRPPRVRREGVEPRARRRVRRGRSDRRRGSDRRGRRGGAAGSDAGAAAGRTTGAWRVARFLGDPAFPKPNRGAIPFSQGSTLS